VESGAAEGRLALVDGRATIQISPDVGPARRLFTFAHELGHAFLLHPRRTLSGDVIRTWSSEETFCNAFAASLLLPRRWLVEHVDGKPENLETLLELASASHVSPTACALRLLGSSLWQRGLLVFSRADRETWWLRNSAGLPRHQKAGLRLLPEMVTRLESIERSESPKPEWLDVWTNGRPRSLATQVAFFGPTCVAFIAVQQWFDTWEPAWLPYGAPRRRSAFVRLGCSPPKVTYVVADFSSDQKSRGRARDGANR
jgi:hypothetical protein